MNAPENKWGYKRGDIPFIDYLCEDKSKYPKASEGISYITNKPLYDPDDDFLLGNSGGILMNINFIVINIERLSRSADAFDEYGTYCDYDPSTPAYESFWQRETSRRKKGVIIKAKLYYKDIPKFFDKATTDEERDLLLKPMRITGAHYTYLNYGRIERTPNAREREKLKREGAEHVETVNALQAGKDLMAVMNQNLRNDLKKDSFTKDEIGGMLNYMREITKMGKDLPKLIAELKEAEDNYIKSKLRKTIVRGGKELAASMDVNNQIDNGIGSGIDIID